MIQGDDTYTAIDDCTRYKIIEIYSRRTSANTVDFIGKLIDQKKFYNKANSKNGLVCNPRIYSCLRKVI